MSTSSGIPAFDFATSTTSGRGGVHLRDDRDQLVRAVPAVAADRVGAPARRAPRRPAPGETPIIVWPRVSKVMVAMSAMLGDARRTPSIAALISFRSDIVSIQMRSTPPGDERRGLLVEDVDGLGVGQRPERLDDLAGRPDVAGHQGVPAGGVDLGAEQDRRGPVQLVDRVGMAAELEARPVPAKGVGEQDLRARVDVARAGSVG